jgi:hypothetical protein
MRDQYTPPFRAGDVAYTRPAPGGYSSAAAVPADPAFSGNDKAYGCPSLGGDFAPGSGAPTPTGVPVAKGSDSDGGAADIGAVPRIDAPPPPTPVTPADLSVSASIPNLIFQGVTPTGGKVVTVTYRINGVATDVLAVQPVLAGDSAAVVAAKVAARLSITPTLVGTSHSNQVTVGTKTPNVLNVLSCAIA